MFNFPALYENVIPLSVFTHALSDKLLKENQIIFDLSLETIQQFEIVMVSCRIKFNHFEGDQSTYRLRCKCCNKLIFGVVHAWVGQKRLKSNILRRFGDRDRNIAFKIQMQCQYRSSICYSYNVTPPTNYIPTLVKPFSFV